MTRHCSGHLSGVRQFARRRLTGGRTTAHGQKPARQFADGFPVEFLIALEDARLSINHGGLTEIGGLWVGEHSDCSREHRGSVIGQLYADGLLDRVGRAPTRTATITETGLMTLDLLGEGQ
jgi:hypothetical protein